MTNGKILSYFFGGDSIDNIAEELSDTYLCNCSEICDTFYSCKNCWKSFLESDDGFYMDIQIPEK